MINRWQPADLNSQEEGILSCFHTKSDLESFGGGMESDLGKLFVGGISWDTNEDRLREYFKNFGEIAEVVIMKDRTTGRARGFGFIVFADPAIAERVAMEKHLIDGRMVEAKKAIPRDDHHILPNKTNIFQVSPGPTRTKKIFVGGLASTVTDADFKKYFEQFGTITDVVVMYDHNTQRPRGFGFITFDSEASVDMVLQRTFHELNGKMVEVKRAVPKELSPGPIMRLPPGGLNYGLNRASSFLNGYNQGINPSSINSSGLRIDSLAPFRKEYPSLGPGNGLGMNFEPRMSPNYSENLYDRAVSNGALSRFSSPLSSSARALWNNGSHCYNTIPASGSRRGSFNGFLGNNGSELGFSPGDLSYATGDNTFGLFSNSYGRRDDIGSLNSSFKYEGDYNDSYGGRSIYRDSTWQSASNELNIGSSPFGYGFGSLASDGVTQSSLDYMSGFNVANRQIDREG